MGSNPIGGATHECHLGREVAFFYYKNLLCFPGFFRYLRRSTRSGKTGAFFLYCYYFGNYILPRSACLKGQLLCCRRSPMLRHRLPPPPCICRFILRISLVIYSCRSNKNEHHCLVFFFFSVFSLALCEFPLYNMNGDTRS